MRKALIRKLHEMQKWRRGANTPMPLSSKEFGECIDECIRLLRRMSDKQYNELYGTKG